MCDSLAPGPDILARAQHADHTTLGLPVTKAILTRLLTATEQEQIVARIESSPDSRQAKYAVLFKPPYNQLTPITEHIALTGSLGLVRESFERFPKPIRCVLNVTHDSPILRIEGVECYRVPIDDTKHEDLTRYFDDVTDKIRHFECQQVATVVHCQVGLSRSASFVLAYLMRFHSMSLEQAFRHVRALRPIAPNLGFLSQLGEYEAKLRGTERCSPWRDHSYNGITRNLPEFIISDFIELYAHEFQPHT